jgi:hypothetical protein
MNIRHLQVHMFLIHVGVTYMKRLDQGQLHPKLEVPRLTCPCGDRTLSSTFGGEHSRKEPCEQLNLLFKTSTDSYLFLELFFFAHLNSVS